MPDFLLVAAVLVLITVVLGVVRILRDTSNAKRMMAVQLLATGGVAALLLFGTASGTDGTVDVALTLALLAAFAVIAFVKKGGIGEAALPDPPSAASPGAAGSTGDAGDAAARNLR